MVLLKLILAYVLALAGAGLAVVVLYAPAREYVRRRFKKTTDELVDVYVWLPPKRLLLSFCISPVVCALAGWSVTHNMLLAAAAGVGGMIVPEQVASMLKHRRLEKFNTQLVDALLNLSSSLRAGLSVPQAFEVLAEEMPPPMSQEFSLVVKETKMGLMLNESLMRLRKRMPSDDLALVVTALLVARETGGDITQVFTQLVQTIRDRRKVKDKLGALTLQAKLQGGVLCALPVFFAYFAQSMSPNYFKIFFSNPTGRILLTVAVMGEVIGVFLIWRFSRVRM